MIVFYVICGVLGTGTTVYFISRMCKVVEKMFKKIDIHSTGEDK